MERSDNQDFNQTTGNAASGFSSSGVGSSGIEGSNTSSESLTDVTETESGIKGKLKSVGSTVKDKAAGLPGLLADGLEAGARALRQRQPAASGADGTAVAISSDSSVAAVTDTLASGMQSSADWIRDADVEKLKDGVEKQVKEHPARSLLIALGAGYLIGKALRR
jgi:hypothetical protein